MNTKYDLGLASVLWLWHNGHNLDLVPYCTKHQYVEPTVAHCSTLPPLPPPPGLFCAVLPLVELGCRTILFVPESWGLLSSWLYIHWILPTLHILHSLVLRGLRSCWLRNLWLLHNLWGTSLREKVKFSTPLCLINNTCMGNVLNKYLILISFFVLSSL